ncbi:MAG TPA: sugar transferase [Terriglobia bacterium]|nr:sugar transferase [Terriglobia bacterium]
MILHQTRGLIRLRRTLDFVCAGMGLLLLSPLFILIAVAIMLQDGGPVFYSQWRVGRDFRLFRLHKFRSMAPDADRSGQLLTAPHDRRLTRIGRLLRRYKLDELPQLINVLRGDMQLVGSRPEVERYVRMFPVEYAEILRDRPGITDPASVVFRHEDRLLSAAEIEREYVERILPAKLKLSLDYARCRTITSDLMVIFATLFGSALLPGLRGRYKPAYSIED